MYVVLKRYLVNWILDTWLKKEFALASQTRSSRLIHDLCSPAPATRVSAGAEPLRYCCSPHTFSTSWFTALSVCYLFDFGGISKEEDLD